MFFFEAAFKKRKERNPKFEVSDFADFSLHGIPMHYSSKTNTCL